MTSDDSHWYIKFFSLLHWMVRHNTGPDHMLKGIMTHSIFGFTLIFAKLNGGPIKLASILYHHTHCGPRFINSYKRNPVSP